MGNNNHGESEKENKSIVYSTQVRVRRQGGDNVISMPCQCASHQACSSGTHPATCQAALPLEGPPWWLPFEKTGPLKTPVPDSRVRAAVASAEAVAVASRHVHVAAASCHVHVAVASPGDGPGGDQACGHGDPEEAGTVLASGGNPC
eukprot:TRINITY_DN55228_c0_g2_i1.p1 TRINITY_DN55228_c0_g2~~TRINITY_DN55228_c0_g2_i1.p1  ORF type:complete len:147 (-),score=11.22 TRINITY_DN55228_c0_g2_i1:127-567(-)